MTLTPELARWRKAQRAALIERRVAASAQDHARWSERIETFLEQGFPSLSTLTVGICWPYLAEFDARPLAERLLARGARAALPVVVAKGQPLEFRDWFPECPMTVGVYDLPVPDGTSRCRPDALLVPVVGIGLQGDRLGYGGGFFDRTLASLDPKPLSIAIAFELSRVDTTYPQDHDILMDFVVTERGIEAVVPAGLEPLDVEAAARRSAELLRVRGLPTASEADQKPPENRR